MRIFLIHFLSSCIPLITHSGSVHDDIRPTISEECLNCLAKVGSDNDGTCTDHPGLPNTDLCGVFKMSFVFYKDAKANGFDPPSEFYSETDENEWRLCSLNDACARSAVKVYMRHYGNAANDCQPLTCSTFIQLHSAGPNGCSSSYPEELLRNTTKLCGCEVVYEDEQACAVTKSTTQIPGELLSVAIAVPIAGLVLITAVVWYCCCSRARHSINSTTANRAALRIVPRNLNLGSSRDKDDYALSTEFNTNVNHYLQDRSMPQFRHTQPEEPEQPPEQPPRATLTFTSQDGHMSTLDMRTLKVPPPPMKTCKMETDDMPYDSAVPYCVSQSHSQCVENIEEKESSSDIASVQAGYYVHEVSVGKNHDYINLEEIKIPMSPTSVSEDDYVNHNIVDKAAVLNNRKRSDLNSSSVTPKVPIPVPRRESISMYNTPDPIIKISCSNHH